jgi:hypothetical protein
MDFRMEAKDTKLPKTGHDYARQDPDQHKSMFRLTPYLSNQQRYNLGLFKYAGGDQGFMYIYFYNPVANFAVEYLP